MAVVGKRLLEAGLLHAGAKTVTGRTLGEEIRAASEPPGQNVIKPLEKALKPEGGIAILRGNLAPDGCVIKISGQKKYSHRGPARVFEREEDAFQAVKKGKIKPNDVIVIRYEGPKGGPGMPKYAWEGKLVETTDVINELKPRYIEKFLPVAHVYDNVAKKRAYYGVPIECQTMSAVPMPPASPPWS